MSAMKITVKPLKGPSFEVEAEAKDKVEDLKRRIAEAKPDFPADLQKLLCAGKVLVDGTDVCECGIQPGSFIVVMVGKAKPSANAAGATVPAPADAAAPADSAVTNAGSSPPGVATTTPASAQPSATNDAAVAQLCEMGFPRDEVERCLRAAFGNADRAVEFLTTGIPSAARATSRSRSPRQGHGHGDHAGHHVAGHGDGHDCSGHGDGHDCSEHSHDDGDQGHGHGGHGDAGHPADPVMAMLAAMGARTGNEGDASDHVAGDAAEGAETVQVSDADQAVVERLVALGFSAERALEAYLACDRKEEVAANFLFESSGD